VNFGVNHQRRRGLADKRTIDLLAEKAGQFAIFFGACIAGKHADLRERDDSRAMNIEPQNKEPQNFEGLKS